MFSIFSSKSTIRAGELLQVDMHSHILPGIDDGPKDVDASIVLIDGLIDLGYKKLITTPHVHVGNYPNTPESIESSMQLLNIELDRRGYAIDISYGAEYMLDEHFLKLLDKEEVICFGKRYLLIETLVQGSPQDLQEMIFHIQLKNYQPILAHPERYHYVDKSLRSLEPLKVRNCLFQVNILSFMGYYGRREQEIALRLLDAGMVDFIGTDLHHRQQLRKTKDFTIPRKLAKQIEAISFQNTEL